MLLSQLAMYIIVEIPEIMTIAKTKKHGKSSNMFYFIQSLTML